GVFFVPLAPIRDPALVLPAIARALRVKDVSDQPPTEALRAALRGRRLLLVLDNFEQLMAATSQVAEVLRMAPDLKVLITSRAALHLSGEHLFAVPPLELPDLDALPPLNELARWPAVELFTTRVCAIKPDFALTADNARTVVEICACLDGLPLAIELAAARSRLFTAQALLDRLRGASGPTTLQFLVDGPRDLLAHQQTLRSTIDWSYDLLAAGERQLLMRLAVFIGGVALEAATAVMSFELRVMSSDLHNSELIAQNSELDILDGLTSLVDKSLLNYETGADGEPRFTMLETIREYAREKLEASGQSDLARRRHAAYYLALASAAEREPDGARQECWFHRLDAEYNNLRAALEWCAANDLVSGLRLAASLRQFWHARGRLNEGRSWLETLLSRADTTELPASVRARALCVAGFLAYQQGDLARAATLSERSLALYRTLDEPCGSADVLYNLGGVAFLRNEYARAAALFDECLALYRELGNRADVAQVLKNLGLIAKDQGDFARATVFYEESLALRRAAGDKRGVAQVLFNLGVVAYWQGDYASAAALAEQSLGFYRELGDKMGVAYTLETLGMALLKQGDHAPAMRLLEESLRILRELGDQIGIALLLTDMGLAAWAQGDSACAAHLHREGLMVSWTIGDKRRMAFCLEGLATALATQQPARAARLYGAAEGLREAIGAPLPPAERADYERDVAAARTGDAGSLGRQGAFAAAWADGRKLPLEQAVTYALSE
ncbi:MAG TPA: tetratricopeptide repeat protein, partial [Roseiflexaceae bacterium]